MSSGGHLWVIRGILASLPATACRSYSC